MIRCALRSSSRKALVLPAQSGALFGRGIAPDLGAALLGKRLVDAGGALLPPGGQVRGIQPFAPQQRSNRPGSCSGVGFGENAFLVLGSKGATAGFRGDLRVKRRRASTAPVLPA